MVVPPDPAVPVGHIVLMIYIWPCMVVYFIILLVIVVRRRKVNLFRTTYFTLTLYQSIADVLIFLHVELAMRPRKFRFFGWNAVEQSPEWFAAFSYASCLILQSVVYFGYLNIAVNRYSILARPATHAKFWSHTNIVLICVAEWTFAIAAPLIMLRFSSDPIRFVLLADGIVVMVSNSFTIFDTTFAFVLNLIVLFVCFTLYHKTKIKLKSKSISSHLSVHDLERQLFIFSIVTFMPLIMEMGRSSAMAYAVFVGNTTLLSITTDLWFYIAEIVITMPMWTLVLASKKIRMEFVQQLALSFSRRDSRVGVINY